MQLEWSSGQLTVGSGQGQPFRSLLLTLSFLQSSQTSKVLIGQSCFTAKDHKGLKGRKITFEVFIANIGFCAKLTDLEGFELTKMFYHKGPQRITKDLRGQKVTFEVFIANIGFFAKLTDLEGFELTKDLPQRIIKDLKNAK